MYAYKNYVWKQIKKNNLFKAVNMSYKQINQDKK